MLSHRNRCLLCVGITVWIRSESVSAFDRNHCLEWVGIRTFSASGLSGYAGLRKQPREECLSTVEAIGRVIGLLESGELENLLLTPFRHMVAQQLAFREEKAVPTQGLDSTDQAREGPTVGPG